MPERRRATGSRRIPVASQGGAVAGPMLPSAVVLAEEKAMNRRRKITRKQARRTQSVLGKLTRMRGSSRRQQMPGRSAATNGKCVARESAKRKRNALDGFRTDFLQLSSQIGFHVAGGVHRFCPRADRLGFRHREMANDFFQFRNGLWRHAELPETHADQ